MINEATQTISPDFTFTANYVEVHGSKMHYVDEGAGDPILFLHGNPTSSYLWRNIIPYAATNGRAIAPDNIGFGKSDKPDIDYRFVDHARYIEGFIEALGLKNITLVLHDWGSALGFHYAMRHQDNIKALVFMEAMLMPVPSWEALPEDFSALLRKFRTPEAGWELLVNQNMFIEQVLPHGVTRQLSEAEMNHYRAPFKEPASRKPIWRWPNEIPLAGEPADVTEAVMAYNQKLQQSDLPKLLFYVTPGGIITEPVRQWAEQHLKNLKTVKLGPGNHYVQEDYPHQIGAELVAWYSRL